MENKMDFSKYLIFLAVTAILAGCGGGSNSTPSSPSNPVPTSVIYKVGDSLTYSYSTTATGTTTGSPNTYLFTRTYTNVNTDSSFSRTDTYSDFGSFTQFNYDANFSIISMKFGNTNCTNMPAAKASPTPPYIIGQSWDSTWTRNCLTSTTSSAGSYSSKGSVTGMESITTEAGTFANAFKEVNVYIGTTKDGISTTISTCWRDKDLKVAVLCNETYTFAPADKVKPITTYAIVQRLIGVSANTFAASTPVVSRFAGYWTIHWAAAGSCDYFQVSVTGQITATCISGSGVNGNFTGSIDAAGNMQGTLKTGTVSGTFSGIFSSPLNGSGTVSFPGAANQPWTMAHI